MENIDLFPVITTAAYTRRTGITPAAPVRRPLQPVEAREIKLKPFFITRLAMREAQMLRVVIFDNTRRFIKCNRMIDEACRVIEKSLTDGMTRAERNLMLFLEYHFREATKNSLQMLRLQVDQFTKSVAPEAGDMTITAQAELTRFLARIAVETMEEAAIRLIAARIAPELLFHKETVDGLVALQTACIATEDVVAHPQTVEADPRKQKALEDTLDACIRVLKQTSIVQSDKFTCCGTCKHFTYPDETPGHCLWSNFKASIDRPACKRFKRINSE